jgi:hypothetical protein
MVLAEATKTKELGERQGVATGSGMRGGVQKVRMCVRRFVENRGEEAGAAWG